MKVKSKKLTFLLIALFLIMGQIQSSNALYYWDEIHTYDVTNEMFRRQSCNGGSYHHVDADDPNDIRLKIETNRWYHDAWAEFEYDTGKPGTTGVGPIATDAKYRARIKWTFTGFFDDNEKSGTFLKFVYKIYYLDGQDVVYLDTYGGYYKIDNGDQTYYNKVFIHYVETTNKAPEGEKLFLSIYFKAQIEASWSNNDLETDFKDGANKIILQEFTFYKLVYYEDPIGPWE